MKLTRRNLLLSTAVGACSQPTLARSEGPRQETTDLPDGVIEPYRWEERQIPFSGLGSRATHILDEAVTKAMRDYGIVGCGVCVVRADRIQYSKGFGYAQLPKTPFLTTTASRCGSLAKSVTALSALILFDQGKLDLDAEILPILKAAGIVPQPVGNSKMDERVARITVRNLMDHTSGFSGATTYTAWRADRNVAALHNLNHVATAADVVSDALGNAQLDSEPGTQFQYANANFVVLARVIEAKSGMTFNNFLTRVAMARFGLKPDEIFVSRNQNAFNSARRGKNEATYYQTTAERFVSFVPAEQRQGRIYGEAYRGYATESSDGAGGIACTAQSLGKIVANLNSAKPALSKRAISEILTAPSHYAKEPNFDAAHSGFYSKGFNVRLYGGRAWFHHGGMTQHCGGVIGHNAGYQFVGVSNWNNAQAPFVDSILNDALTSAVGQLG